MPYHKAKSSGKSTRTRIIGEGMINFKVLCLYLFGEENINWFFLFVGIISVSRDQINRAKIWFPNLKNTV